MSKKIEPGMSALVAIVSAEHVGSVDYALKGVAIEISAQALDEELLAKLGAGDESAAKKIDIE